MAARFVLRVRKKGVLILPKALREASGLTEGDDVVAEVVEDGIVLRPLRPVRVRVDPEVVESLLREEFEIEEERLRRLVRNAGSPGP